MATKRVLDLSSLTAGDAIRSITQPVSLFDALPNKKKGYGYIREVQASVLKSWYPRRNEKDLVIKTNTGGGKTIVGLIMLQSSLHEGLGPALYVTPDGHLADQVREEGRALGLDVVSDPESPKFTNSKAICVTTMQILMNGKSRFGILGSPTRQPIPVGSVIIDDAHAALGIAEESCRIVIPSGHDKFSMLLDIFEDDLKHQGLNAYLDIREKDPGAVQRIPFWAWAERQEEVVKLLRPHRAEKEFEWAWPLLSDLLPICEVTVTSSEIEIKPPLPPVEKLPSFSEARRRIYMTATLSDDSPLVTHFNADPETIARSIVPDSAADLGDRLILAPQDLNPHIDQEEIYELAVSIAQDWNVVVLVPSWRIANQWQESADYIASKNEDISDILSQLKSESHVGLVVIVNRYDGIDLPDDACRLLIIDNLPFAFSPSERREATALRDSEAMVARQLQRLEQGIGRGVRSRDDRCAVVLSGPRLAQLVARANAAGKFSATTRAQMELSLAVSEQLEGASSEDVEGLIRQIIEGDEDFRTASREVLLGVNYETAEVTDSAIHLRTAYDAARRQRYEEASREADHAVNSALNTGDIQLAGWLGETHASYLDHVDKVTSQQVLGRASRNNSAVLTPLDGIDYTHLNDITNQAVQASAFLSENYGTGAELILGFKAMMSDLAWDEYGTEQAEEALAALGKHLGFLAQRPEREFKIGNDVLWSLGQKRYAVIEAKTGAQGERVWKKDINQLAGSVNWCKNEYGSESTIIPVSVHPSHVVEASGTPPPGCRTINRASLRKLKSTMKNFARALASNKTYRSENLVQQQLSQFELTATDFFDAYSYHTKREPKQPLNT